MGQRVPERDERRRPPSDRQVRVRGDPACVGIGVDAAGLEGRDLGHVEDVADVDAVARDLDPAEAVDREVAERMGGRGGRREQGGDGDEQDEESLHRSSLLATGPQSTEKCGFSAQRAREPASRLRPVAEALLDHPAMEDLERIERPEPERALREAQRLAAVPVPCERPSQDVVPVDRRALALRKARERKRRMKPDAVVDVEERGLEVGLDAVRDQQPLDHADQRVLPACVRVVAGGALEITEHRDVLRERDQVHRFLLEPRSPP